MDSDQRAYLGKLRRFWEIDDITELKFNRVDTLYGSDRTDLRFDEAADERVTWILDGLSLPVQPRIVEIGCGIGAIIKRILAAYPDVEIWGLDISAAMINEAKRLLGESPHIHLEVTKGDSLGTIPDRSIDLVICTGVFIHILDIGLIRGYISEACRVLKPGGSFRFNARYWNPQLSFGNSLGGRMARFLYRIGWHSSLKPHKLNKIQAADFNGLYFTLSDIETLTQEAGFIPEQFILLTEDVSPAHGLIRVNCHRIGTSGGKPATSSRSNHTAQHV
jgi:ubiquinone/menaquinone biosynthesis C-methylase UbiE